MELRDIVKVDKMRTLEGSKVKAFVDVLINDDIVIKGFRVVESEKGLFVGMPRELGKDKKTYFDTVYPINNPARQDLTQIILTYYEANKSQEETSGK